MAGFVLIAIAILGIVQGVRAFDCETVSFGRELMTCYQTQAGAYGAEPAGALLLSLGLLLAIVGVSTIARRSR